MAVRIYQIVVRPLFPPCCRFVPSCSEFAIQQIQSVGVIKGCMVFFGRFLRCHWLSR